MLTVIVPVRDWPAERIAACTQSFLRLSSRYLAEIVIVDFGSATPAVAPVSDDRVRVVRAEAEIWSLAEAINVGVLHSRGDVFAKTDADILIAPGSAAAFDAAVDQVASGRVGLALSQATDLPETMSVAEAVAASTAERDRAGRLRPRWGQGGLAMFSRATWDAIGGFDSRFTGWGSEDNDFAERVRRSGRRVRWLDRDAVRIHHIWHPPSFLEKSVAATPAANRALATSDRSVFRAMRVRHSSPPAGYAGRELHRPNLARRNAPLFSLAIATSERPNRLRMLKEAIRSHVGQADNDMEIIVADNGSTADENARLRDALERLRLPVGVRHLHLPTSSIPAARNAITETAEGRYICVVDDDDIALPNRLADHLACFEKGEGVHGSHGGWIDFDEETGVTETNEGRQRTLEVLLFGKSKISLHPTCCYRADVFRAIGYDESLALGSDFDLALRMAHAGFKVAHTVSIVLLRRFHSKNVTLTGLPNQAMNGAFARRRIMDSIGPAMCHNLSLKAKETGGTVPCRNRIGPQRVVDLLPASAGVWRLHFPFAALARSGAPALPGDAPTEAAADQSERIARILEVVDGDVSALAPGLGAELAFVSRPIKGAARAVRARRRLAALGIDAELTPDKVFRERLQDGFNWDALTVPRGTRRLLSEPVEDPIELTEPLAALPPASVLRGMLSILADSTPKGFRYHLVTGPLHGRKRVDATAAAIRGALPLRFDAVASGGVQCDF